MTLVTTYDPKPVPDRRWDWSAYNDATHDLGSIVGHGATEQTAVADLMEQRES